MRLSLVIGHHGLISVVSSFHVDEKTVQNGIFNIAKGRNLEPKRVFELVYRILVGEPRGPRLGSYIVAMGKENVSEALKRVIETQ